MINRDAKATIERLMQQFPAVAILGPRQVGKTTLALEIAGHTKPEPIYLDLESPRDLNKLSEPELYFETHSDKLIILDEVQRTPDLFPVLRGVIDQRRRSQQQHGQFLILGSATLDLLQQSSESLAGRIAYVELSGLKASEIKISGANNIDRLWLRGGFPNSFLARSDAESFEWRQVFIKTYLEREIPQIGPRIAAKTLQNFWTMLAHSQGGILNQSRLATGLGVSVPTINRYLGLLEDLLLVRRLQPWARNVGKRLVKAPKVYVRDSGITHALLNIVSQDDLMGNPVKGYSWEGFVIENLLADLPSGVNAWFYRTSAGAEIDLLIEAGSKKRIAIEIKRSLTPTLSKGFINGCEDVQATHKFFVYPGKETYPLTKSIQAIPLRDLSIQLQDLLKTNKR